MALLLPALLLGTCARDSALHSPPLACSAPRVTGRLPAELAEASGLAPASSIAHFWAISDGGSPLLYAVDSAGAIRASVTVAGAGKRDWESLAAASCAAGTCLYIADIGDNLRNRERLRLYRVPEPTLFADSTATADIFEFRFPDGPHDAEAVFVLPGEQLYVVTKGRGEPVTVYHYPGSLTDEDSVVTLTPVQRLTPGLVQLPDMITGAGATPDGSWIVLRTYAYAQLYQLVAGRLVPRLDAPGLDLQALHEQQGEGVDVRSDGTLLLLSEKGLDENNPPVSRLDCSLPGQRE
jgi:hypothetical protein